MKSKNILYSKTFVSLFLVSFLIFISSTALADPVQGASPAAIYAYISNQDGTISVLDTTNSTITATVNVGGISQWSCSQPGWKKGICGELFEQYCLCNNYNN
jgi:hypothetical protein